MLTKEQALGLAFFVAIFCLTHLIVMQDMKHRFWLDNTQYEQVGVMAYESNGDTVYFPVFKKRIK